MTMPPIVSHLAVLTVSTCVFLTASPPARGTTESAKLTASDAMAFDRFGQSVAIDGDTMIAGAFAGDGAFSDQGSAYIFTRTGTTWTQQAKLTAIDGAVDDWFGSTVAIFGDTAIVGAFLDDGTAGADQGSAYVFTRTGTTWFQQAKLTSLDPAAGDMFGRTVSISAETAIVGSSSDADVGTNSGSAYVFTRTGTTWTQQAKLTASDAGAGDEFGGDVSIDGDTAIIGAAANDDPIFNQGAAYVFTRTGTTWTQQAKLTAADAGSNDQFGVSVSIDGDTVIIGAHVDDNPAINSGSAYIFTRTGTSWTQQAKLAHADTEFDDLFGGDVAISGDTVIIGAQNNDDVAQNAGSAYVFTRSGTTWIQRVKLTASNPAVEDRFGSSVCIEGNTAFFGASLDDDAAGTDQGVVYLFSQVVPVCLADLNGDGVVNGADLGLVLGSWGPCP